MCGRRQLLSRALVGVLTLFALGLAERPVRPKPLLNAEEATVGQLAIVTYYYSYDVGPAPQLPCWARPVPVQLDSGRFPLYTPPGERTAGFLRAGRDLRTVVAGPHFNDPQYHPASVYLARCSVPDWYRCDFFPIILAESESLFTGIELMPDDDTLLVAYGGYDSRIGPQPPFGVAKYSLRNMRPTDPTFEGRSRYRLGPPVGRFETEEAIWDIRRDPDGNRAYLLGATLFRVPARFTLYTINVASMAEIAPRLEVPPINISGDNLLGSGFIPHLALSPDGRWLLILTGARRPDMTPVVDLVERRLSTLRLGSNAFFVVDASFSAGPVNQGLLGLVLGQRKVAQKAADLWLAVGRLDSSGFSELSRAFVSPAVGLTEYAPVDWAAGGESLVLAYGGCGEPKLGWPRLAVYAVGEGGRSLALWREYRRPCWEDFSVPPDHQFSRYGPVDILTDNGYRATVTPTPTASPSPTSLPSTATTSPTASPTPTNIASSTASPTATNTATLTPSPPPRRPLRPAYLPVALREECPIKRQYADVALVIDASTTMRDHRTAAGRPKLHAAIEAASLLLDLLSLPQDRAAVVIFNAEAHLLQPLSGDRAALKAALNSIPGQVRLLTRIHRGLEVAQAELTGPHHWPTNRPVLILLTDGLANPDPVALALDRADKAKAAGIILFTIGLGQPGQLNFEELRQMASLPEYFFHAPDGEDLLAIYRQIGLELPCPGARFWGGR